MLLSNCGTNQFGLISLHDHFITNCCEEQLFLGRVVQISEKGQVIELEEKIGIGRAIYFVVSGTEEGCSELSIQVMGAGIFLEDTDHHSLVATVLGKLGTCCNESGSVALAVVVGVNIEGGENVEVGPVGLDDGLIDLTPRPPLHLRGEGELYPVGVRDGSILWCC